MKPLNKILLGEYQFRHDFAVFSWQCLPYTIIGKITQRVEVPTHLSIISANRLLAITTRDWMWSAYDKND